MGISWRVQGGHQLEGQRSEVQVQRQEPLTVFQVIREARLQGTQAQYMRGQGGQCTA